MSLRQVLIWLVSLLLLGGVFTWIAMNTYWADTKEDVPLQGEALDNPFYVAEHFAKEMGARTHWQRGLKLPGSHGIVMLTGWNWDQPSDRAQLIQHWVEAGGRLVVHDGVFSGSNAFRKWAGIQNASDERYPETRNGRVSVKMRAAKAECGPYSEVGGAGSHYSVCDLYVYANYKSTHPVLWALRAEDPAQIVAIRVRVGLGSVTVLNGYPFYEKKLLAADNALLFIAATELHRGDEINFLAENKIESLLALTWRLGWPVFILSGAWIALTLWRDGTRFGPRAATPDTARRSLAEQIQGAGRFTLRVGGGASLLQATIRALNETGIRYINAYEALSESERLSELAKVTGYNSYDLGAALHYSGSPHADQLRAAIELLESARRRVLLKYTRSGHGN